MIELNHIAKRYKKHAVLKNVHFKMETGEKIFLSGASGAGKSTLLKIIAALEKPTSGEVFFNGQSLSKMRPAALPFLRRHFGLIFQDPKLLFDRNALENVLFPLEVQGFFSFRTAKKRAEAALDKVGLLNQSRAMPMELSGGEQQRLAIARAVVNHPSVLIADEPTSHLDKETAQEIRALFKDFNSVGVAMLIVSHDQSWWEEENTKHFVLKDGVLV